MSIAYSRPLILAEDELAEGVYTASGSESINTSTNTNTSTSVGYSIALESDYGTGGKYYRLEIDASSLTASDTWSITLTISGGDASSIRLDDGRMTATLNGNKITVTGIGGVHYYSIGIYVACGSGVTVS